MCVSERHLRNSTPTRPDRTTKNEFCWVVNYYPYQLSFARFLICFPAARHDSDIMHKSSPYYSKSAAVSSSIAAEALKRPERKKHVSEITSRYARTLVNYKRIWLNTHDDFMENGDKTFLWGKI